MTPDSVANDVVVWVNDYIGWEPLSQVACTIYLAINWDLAAVVCGLMGLVTLIFWLE